MNTMGSFSRAAKLWLVLALASILAKKLAVLVAPPLTVIDMLP